MSPNGAVLRDYDLGPGSAPTSVTTGPGGRVWVAATGLHQLVWFDATSAAPTPHDVITPSDCGPVAIVDGQDGNMYFSMPVPFGAGPACMAAGNQLGSVTGGGVVTATAVGGQVFDLEVLNGGLFAPDRAGGFVRRLSLPNLTVDWTLSIPGGPDGVTHDQAGNIWVAESNGVVARFATNGSMLRQFAPSGGTLTQPGGIVAGNDGYIYVAGEGSANIVRVAADGSFAFYSLPDSRPHDIINGPDGDPWFTDNTGTQILRLINSAPRATTGAASATGPTSASAGATVDPRGNETQVVFEYGPTTAYGATSAPVVVPNGADPVQATGVLTRLKPSTTYHVRAHATNAEGSATGADTTFTTQVGDADGDGVSASSDCNDNNPAIHPGANDKPGDKIDQDCSGADATYPRLASRIRYVFRRNLLRRTWRVRKLEIIGAVSGSRVELRCHGRGCFTHRAIRVRKSRKILSLLSRNVKRARLKRGVVFEVRITKKSHVGLMKRFTVRSGSREPKAQEYCLPVGKGRPTRC
jgi:streptogramin lyase